MPQLAYVQQTQLQFNWCWAAVAASTSGFYDPASTWTQCDLVNEEQGLVDCCLNGASAACDVPWYLHLALTRTGNLRARWGSFATEQEIRDEIDAARPLCVRIGWSGGTGHFVVIAGYDVDIVTGELILTVHDPFSGLNTLSYDELRLSYLNDGTWSHSYFTEA